MDRRVKEAKTVKKIWMILLVALLVLTAFWLDRDTDTEADRNQSPQQAQGVGTQGQPEQEPVPGQGEDAEGEPAQSGNAVKDRMALPDPDTVAEMAHLEPLLSQKMTREEMQVWLESIGQLPEEEQLLVLAEYAYGVDHEGLDPEGIIGLLRFVQPMLARLSAQEIAQLLDSGLYGEMFQIYLLDLSSSSLNPEMDPSDPVFQASVNRLICSPDTAERVKTYALTSLKTAADETAQYLLEAFQTQDETFYAISILEALRHSAPEAAREAAQYALDWADEYGYYSEGTVELAREILGLAKSGQ